MYQLYHSPLLIVALRPGLAFVPNLRFLLKLGDAAAIRLVALDEKGVLGPVLRFTVLKDLGDFAFSNSNLNSVP